MLCLSSLLQFRTLLPQLVNVVLFLAPMFAFRALSLYKSRAALNLSDVGGFASDVFVAVTLSLLCLALPRRQYWAAFAFMSIFSVLFSYANYEHIRVLGAALDLQGAHFLKDPVFLKGSITSFHGISGSVALTLVFLLVCLVASVFYFRDSPRFGKSKPIAIAQSIVLIASSFVVTQALRPSSGMGQTWRSFHPLHLNLSRLARTLNARIETRIVLSGDDAEQIAKDIEKIAGRDLNGVPMLATKARRPNILLVTLEGLSGGYVVSSEYSEQRCNSLGLPKFRELTRDGLFFANFVAHNRQTNRGQYSLLCGDYPSLASDRTKFDKYLNRGSGIITDRKCLPTILSEAGYRTDYLQAAEMSFMSKDQFMPLAGFQTADGKNWFSRAYTWIGWGADDKAFLERSLDRIDHLQKQDKPWFLNLMTAGTHHPYSVPGGFSQRFPSETMQAALEYLDDALVDFIAELKRKDLFSNTLVIFTSDESSGCDTGSDLQRASSQAWAPLVVYGPEVTSGSVQEMFSQSDMMLSILDYMGIAGANPNVNGRSYFRSYSESRPIAFANYYSKRVGLIHGDRNGILCEYGFEKCISYERSSNDVYPKNFAELPYDSYYRVLLQSFVTLNDSATSDEDRSAVKTQVLAHSGTIELHRQEKPIVLLAHQYLQIPPSFRISVEFEIEAVNEDVDLIFDLATDHSQRQLIEPRTFELRKGQVLALSAQYLTLDELHDAEIRLFATPTKKARARINIVKAVAEFSPHSVEENAFSISRSEIRERKTQ